MHKYIWLVKVKKRSDKYIFVGGVAGMFVFFNVSCYGPSSGPDNTYSIQYDIAAEVTINKMCAILEFNNI